MKDLIVFNHSWYFSNIYSYHLIVIITSVDSVLNDSAHEIQLYNGMVTMHTHSLDAKNFNFYFL